MKASARNLPALAVSLALHCSLLVVPFLGGMWGKVPSAISILPSSVAFEGSSIEVDAPSPELTAAAEQEIGGEPGEPETEPEAEPAPPAAKPAVAEIVPTATATATPAPKKPRAKPLSSPGAAASSTTASAGAEASAGPSAPGTFGAEGLAPGVRRLGYAFTRAIPVATPADTAWKELEPGVVGTIRIELSVEEGNRLGDVQPLRPRPGEPPLHPALERLVQRTTVLLRAGQFALSGSNQPGKELLVIEVRLKDEAADEDASGLVVQRGFEGATPGRPGRAYFRYDTGRWFEAKVTIVPAKE